MNKIVPLGTLMLAMVAAQPSFAQARVAVLYLAPFDSNIANTAVNIVINGVVVLEGVENKDFTDYIELPAGEYTGRRLTQPIPCTLDPQ